MLVVCERRITNAEKIIYCVLHRDVPAPDGSLAFSGVSSSFLLLFRVGEAAQTFLLSSFFVTLSTVCCCFLYTRQAALQKGSSIHELAQRIIEKRTIENVNFAFYKSSCHVCPTLQEAGTYIEQQRHGAMSYFHVLTHRHSSKRKNVQPNNILAVLPQLNSAINRIMIIIMCFSLLNRDDFKTDFILV